MSSNSARCWGAREDAVAVQQRRQLLAHRRDTSCAPHWFRRDVGRQCDGQRGANGDADGDDVVLGYPLAEREERGTDDGLRVRERVDGFWVDSVLFTPFADDDADLTPVSKRNDGAHAAAGTHGLALWNCVGESAKKREGESDVDEHVEG